MVFRLVSLCVVVSFMVSCSSNKAIVNPALKRSMERLNFSFKDFITEESVFLDIKGDRVSKEEFALLGDKKKVIYGMVDSRTFQIVSRENQGTIRNPEKVHALLRKTSKVDFNSNSPVVIRFYPGLDGCSRTGYTMKESTKRTFTTFKQNLQNLGDTKPIFLYKHPVEKKKFDGIIDWEKDLDGAFEELFFPVHCPCGSNAIMATNGDYYVNHGESSHQYLLIMYEKLQNAQKEE